MKMVRLRTIPRWQLVEYVLGGLILLACSYYATTMVDVYTSQLKNGGSFFATLLLLIVHTCVVLLCLVGISIIFDVFCDKSPQAGTGEAILSDRSTKSLACRVPVGICAFGVTSVVVLLVMHSGQRDAFSYTVSIAVIAAMTTLIAWLIVKPEQNRQGTAAGR